MNALVGIAGLIAVAAVTPGPNNLIVMRAAARSGLAAALPAIAGIVLGGLALLLVIAAGIGVLFMAAPRLQAAITIGGCAYLIWLAIKLIAKSFNYRINETVNDSKTRTAGFGGLFVFQFLNPKGWVMLLTAASLVSATSAIGAFARLAAVFVPISLVCLFAWAVFGSLLTAQLSRPVVGRWFDRVMGGFLIGVAVLLLFEI